ncbi:MAG: MFS transporter [Deltaproteobacteria bacterium]|nr:MFS transporter [Deltaproteobacteria bacterium]
MMNSQTDSIIEKVNPRWILLVVGLGTLMSSMTVSMVNLALPSIGRDFSVTIEASRWVVQAFLLVNAVLLLPFGWLSDRIGHGRLYLIGFAVVGMGSLLCGLSNWFSLLIAGRVLQGLGGAMVMATGPALLTTHISPSKRGRALGILSTATYLGLTAGPPLAGVIISELDWRWTFLVAVPVSVIVTIMGILVFPPRKITADKDSTKGRFDLPGAFALMLGLPLVLLALSQGRNGASSSILLMGGAGVVILIDFVFYELRVKSPLLDVRMFKTRNLSVASLSAVANYIALFTVLMLLPFYLEEGLGFSTAKTGMLLSAQPLMMALFATPSGWLSDRFGSRIFAKAGMGIMGIGLLGLSFADDNSCIAIIIVWLGLIGMGTGIFISPNSSMLMGSAPKTRQGVAGSVMAEARIMGMLFGVALAATLFAKAGGTTGKVWTIVDFAAFQTAVRVGAGVAFLGMIITFFSTLNKKIQ